MPRSRAIQLLSILEFELSRHIVRRRIYFMAVVLALIIALPITVKYVLNVPNPDSPKEFLENELGSISILIVLSATFFAGDALASEYEKKTGYVLFPNPVRREIIYAGKFLASFLISMGVISIYYFVVGMETYHYYGKIPHEFWLSFAFSTLYTLSVVGLAYLYSSILSSAMSSTLLTFFTLFMILPAISSITMLSGVEPWFILTYCGDIITLVFNPPDKRVEKISVRGFTFYVFYPDINVSCMVMLAYAIVTILSSLRIFKHRELKE